MKTFVSLFAVMISLAVAHADPSPEWVARKHTIHAAQDLFRVGRTQEAVAYVQANLAIPPGHDRTTEVAYGLTEIAWTFHNQRQLTTARKVALEALSVIDPILKKKTHSAEEAELLGNIGLVCERILFAPDLAQPLYEAALATQPNDRQTEQRLHELKERAKHLPQKGGA